MTAWVLVLAGVTAGDGGVGTRAAGEPIGAVPRLDVKWQGKGLVGSRPVRVWLGPEKLAWGDGVYPECYPWPRFHPDGRIGGGQFTYELDRDRLTIRGGECRFILHPAARKP
jgi:hypothetical protein